MNGYPILTHRIVVSSSFSKERPSYDLSIERHSVQEFLVECCFPWGLSLGNLLTGIVMLSDSFRGVQKPEE